MKALIFISILVASSANAAYLHCATGEKQYPRAEVTQDKNCSSGLRVAMGPEIGCLDDGSHKMKAGSTYEVCAHFDKVLNKTTVSSAEPLAGK